LDENIHTQLINELNKVKKGGEIRATYFVFTDPKITQSLIAAHTRGVDVHVTVDACGHNQKQAEALDNADVPVRMFNSDGNLGKSNLHSKSTLIQHADGSTVVFLGSANASAQSTRNSEVVIITENENQFYKDNKRYSILAWNLSHDYNLIKNKEKLPKSRLKNFFGETFKNELRKTPTDMTLIHSGVYDLTMAAFVHRIKNTDPDTQQLDIVTYSFNNSSFLSAVRKFFTKGGKGRFITDQGALRDHQSFLADIATKGALVYTYSPTKRYKSGVSLQHAKILVRHDPTNPLVVISENNPTDEAFYDAGKAVLYPGDTTLAKSTTTIINTLITYCNLYVPEPQTSDDELNPDDTDFTELLNQLNSLDHGENMQALKTMKELEARIKNKITSQVSAQSTRLYTKK
jgi:phosphatidylserine/phosphatidylglycerophosphate/cardiolipin synthase-like enzyme